MDITNNDDNKSLICETTETRINSRTNMIVLANIGFINIAWYTVLALDFFISTIIKIESTSKTPNIDLGISFQCLYALVIVFYLFFALKFASQCIWSLNTKINMNAIALVEIFWQIIELVRELFFIKTTICFGQQHMQLVNARIAIRLVVLAIIMLLNLLFMTTSKQRISKQRLSVTKSNFVLFVPLIANILANCFLITIINSANISTSIYQIYCK